MIYNAARETVEVHDLLQSCHESFCPLCDGRLLARRGELIIWHWAHRPGVGSKRDGCPWEESQWHLGWKIAYQAFPGWQIEHRLDLDGTRYVLDAINPDTKEIREFVHSLSPYYEAKHRTLSKKGYNVKWIFDGKEFASARYSHVQNGRGIKRLLKPRASMLWEEIGGVVHFEDRLWRHWKHDIWYPDESKAASLTLAKGPQQTHSEREARQTRKKVHDAYYTEAFQESGR